MTASGGRNRASPVLRSRLRPHHQIIIVTMIALIAFTIVAIVNGLGLAQIARLAPFPEIPPSATR